jgi:hypothetical protein
MLVDLRLSLTLPPELWKTKQNQSQQQILTFII